MEMLLLIVLLVLIFGGGYDPNQDTDYDTNKDPYTNRQTNQYPSYDTCSNHGSKLYKTAE